MYQSSIWQTSRQPRYRTTAVKRKTAAQSGALHLRAESISVRVPGTTTSGLFFGAVYHAAQLQTLGITGDSDENGAPRWISAFPDTGLQMQRDNGGFALWDERAEEPANGLREGISFARASRIYVSRREAINRGNERPLRYLQAIPVRC